MNTAREYGVNIINFIFAMFPISLIFGNFAINLNIIILLVITTIFFFLKKEKIFLKLNYLDKLILIFFFYTIAVLLINYLIKLINNSTLDEIIIIKTIFYQRYLILYFFIRVLVEKKILNIFWFNRICALCAFFVSSDVIFQFIFDKDFFGIVSPSPRHNSAIFGNELIAGGYIQKFSLFFLIFFTSLKNDLIVKKKFILLVIYFFILTGIILSGNRMPLVLFLISILIFAYLNSKFRENFKKIFLFSLLFVLFFYVTNNNFKNHLNNFYKNGLFLINTTLFKDLSKEPLATSYKPYVVEFYCSKIFIKENPLFGGGIRSYRTHPGGCTTHSHNYYLEIFVDLGLVGLCLFISILYLLIKKIFLNIKFNKKINIEMMPFLLVIITEFFPIRTSGSIFSTGNAAIIFTFLPILISYIFLKNPKN